MSYLDEPQAGQRIYNRCEEWAQISAPGPGVTRLYLSAEHRQAAEVLMGWMTESGMEARIDEVGNVVGRYHAETGVGPYLIMGSHQDSVITGGKYDGPLGVLTALDCVSVLNGEGKRLPFGIEVVAFGDEEGSRFRTTLAGSRGIIGDFGPDLLKASDPEGVSLSDALIEFGLDPALVGNAAHEAGDVLGYVEVHIEQGPVLEAEDLSVGVVTGISAQRRAWLNFHSEPNHAGTVPMQLRHDAMVCAAEAILIIEEAAMSHSDTVATVGSVETKPGLANVICGEVTVSLDLRSHSVDVLNRVYETLKSKINEAAQRRSVQVKYDVLLDLAACPCSEAFVRQLEDAVTATGSRAIRMPSGAGHDGMAMSKLTDIGMLFVRCKDGVSHNPAESVEVVDVDAGAAVLLQFVRNFRPVSQR